MFAGTVSTVLFAVANLPMVVKALQTRDLRSYSPGNLILGNVGNVVHTIYIVSLPFGPIWILHGFYLTTMAIMLALYALQARAARSAPEDDVEGRASSPHPDAETAVRFRHGGRDRRARASADGIPVR